MINAIAVLCDVNFVVTKVLFNSLADLFFNIEGIEFSLLFSNHSRTKAKKFIDELCVKDNVSGWEIDEMGNRAIQKIELFGTKLNKDFLIFGVEEKNDIPYLYEEIIKINNEQTNFIRKILKEKSFVSSHSNQDEAMYDELTKVNNELSNLQREFAKKNVELTKANELKNQFIGMAAHDLRNPLNIILSYIEFMINDSKNLSIKKHEEFLREIYSSSEFMLKLVEDILDVSKIESGKIELHFEKIDIVSLLKRNIRLNNFFAAKKRIKINFNSSLTKKIIEIDSKRMEQVFNNLIGNSIKYSFQDSEINVGIYEEDNSIIVSIKDTGLGIEEDMLNKIFDPFQTAKIPGTAGEKNSGLGLAIVKKIIDGHKGYIWVESKLGKGSEFFCKLPINL